MAQVGNPLPQRPHSSERVLPGPCPIWLWNESRQCHYTSWLKKEFPLFGSLLTPFVNKIALHPQDTNSINKRFNIEYPFPIPLLQSPLESLYHIIGVVGSGFQKPSTKKWGKNAHLSNDQNPPPATFHEIVAGFFWGNPYVGLL